MPGGWSKPRDVARLADSRAVFEYEIPSGELLADRADPGDAGEPFRVSVSFGRLQGFAIADVALQGAVMATCQRCLKPFRMAVQSESRVALLDQSTADAEVPESWESFLATDGELSVRELAGEELLLALPLVARHEGVDDCVAVPAQALTPAQSPAAATAGAAAADAAAMELERRQRPFAALRAMLDESGRED